MDAVDLIQQRLADLQAQHRDGRLQYAELEEDIKQRRATLAGMRRELDMLYGAIEELKQLCGESS